MGHVPRYSTIRRHQRDDPPEQDGIRCGPNMAETKRARAHQPAHHADPGDASAPAWWAGSALIIFYTGLAAGPISVVAPVSGLVSTVLPVAVALAEGERRRSIARRALAGPSATASPQAPRSACSSSLSATPGSPGNSGRWRPGGSASSRSSSSLRQCCGAACCHAAPGEDCCRLRRCGRDRRRREHLLRPRPPGLACSAWQSCSPRSTPESPCCWPGRCSASGCAGPSGPASGLAAIGIIVVAA